MMNPSHLRARTALSAGGVVLALVAGTTSADAATTTLATQAMTDSTPAVVIPLAAPVPSAASGYGPTATVTNGQAARYGAGYLARQITANGGYLAPFGRPDPGSTANAVIALTAAKAGGRARDQAIAYLKTQVNELTDSQGNDNAGALANLILAASAAKESPRAFGGQGPSNDLVARLLATVRTGGSDGGLFGAQDPTYDGAYRQGLALTALRSAGVPSRTVNAAKGWLVRQQCRNGLWVSYRPSTKKPCPVADAASFSGPDTNSTALAVQGLSAFGISPRAGATLRALDGIQSRDAGFPFIAVGGQDSDPNSTAVVIQAILALGGKPAASRWVVKRANPYTALAAYQLGCEASGEQRGAYYYPGSRTANVLATVQAVPAQVGATLPVTGRDIAAYTPASGCAASDGATAGSQWLATKLVDGRFPSQFDSSVTDYGLMVDAVLAMNGSGDAALAGPALAVLDNQAEAKDYFTLHGLLKDPYWAPILATRHDGLDDVEGGKAAKVLVTALAGHRNPRDFGGIDMVAETLASIVPSGQRAGKLIDRGPRYDTLGQPGDGGGYLTTDNANVFGQSLAVIGLAGARALPRPAVDVLVGQQCSEGYFRTFFSSAPNPADPKNPILQTCDEGKAQQTSTPDGDTTGLGLSALLAAKRSGATGLDAAIGRARTWLVSHQIDGGGWGGGAFTPAANTNSTGLVVQALADVGGAQSAVIRGQKYLLSAQADAARDSRNGLKTDLGAIAYSPETYRAARLAGITSSDQWLRATTQASLGLSTASFSSLVGLTSSGHPSVVKQQRSGSSDRVSKYRWRSAS